MLVIAHRNDVPARTVQDVQAAWSALTNQTLRWGSITQASNAGTEPIVWSVSMPGGDALAREVGGTPFRLGSGPDRIEEVS